VASSWILFFSYQDDARSNTHQIYVWLHWRQKRHNTANQQLSGHTSPDTCGYIWGYGYIGARTDTTQKPGQIPDKEAEIKNITMNYNETDTTGMLSLPTVWRQQSEFVSSQPSGQIPAAVGIGIETENYKPLCSYKYGQACRIKCSHACLRCIPRQMLVCCVVSVRAPM